MPDDVRLYIQLTSDGEVYEHLMKLFGSTNRQEFKREFFGSVFFSDTHRFLTRNAKLFKEHFPNVFGVIQRCKKDGYANLARMLQKKESEIIIERICGRLAQEDLPGLFVATIHDSIVVNKRHTELVHRIMLEEFAKEDLQPSITREPLAGEP